jgi:fatty acid desaturase
MHKMKIPAPGEQTIRSAANLFKAVTLVTLLLASYYVTRWAVNMPAFGMLSAWSGAAIKGAVILIMAVWSGVLILGMGVLAHDAVHKVLFRSLYWNELWGGLLSAFTLVPFYANRQFHLTHHGYAHQPGLDPENGMHDRSFWSAMTVGSLVGLYLQYRILFTNMLRITDRRYTGRVVKDLLYLAIVGMVYFGFVPALGISPWVSVVPMILVFPLVFGWRALSDHYAVPAIVRAVKHREDILEADEGAWHRDRSRRQREISGWVVLTHPWLEWLWSHVNYHEVHHKYPWLSHHDLKPVFEATRGTQPYLVVRGYWRSLFNLRRRPYYATRADLQPFLSTPDW